MLGFWSRHKQALRLDEPLHACLRKYFDAWGFCSPSRGRADPSILGFWSRHKQALRLGEPLHALENISMLGDSARLRVVEQILAGLTSGLAIKPW